MQHAAAVGVFDGIADVKESSEQLAQLERPRTGVRLQSLVAVKTADRVLEAIPSDQAHRIERAAVRVHAEGIDRHDAGVFQSPGDLGLEQEARAARRIVGVVILDLLERHLTIQLRVEGDEHGTQSTPGVRADHPEPPAAGWLGVEETSRGLAARGRDPAGDRVRNK